MTTNGKSSLLEILTAMFLLEVIPPDQYCLRLFAVVLFGVGVVTFWILECSGWDKK